MISPALPWWHQSGESGHPMVPVPQPAGIAFQFLEAYNSFKKKTKTDILFSASPIQYLSICSMCALNFYACAQL